jgi:uncharacterized protein (TIGR03067 family)
LNAQTPEIQKEVDITLDLIRLEGVWKPVSLLGPKGRVDKYPIANERLIFKANTFQRKEGDKVVVQGHVTIDPTKNPKGMDWEIEKPMPKAQDSQPTLLDARKLAFGPSDSRLSFVYRRSHRAGLDLKEGGAAIHVELLQDRRFTEQQSKHIRRGMTVAQATSLLGCPSGDYTGGKGLYVAFIDPFPLAAFQRHYPVHWCGHTGAIGLELDKDGKVRWADWYPALDPENAPEAALASRSPAGSSGWPKDVTPTEKKVFLKLFEKLPTEREGFYTEEAIDKAEPYLRVLLALTRADIERYATGQGVKKENISLYPFAALSAGLLERKGPREYVVQYFGGIAHPELKLGWAAGLFNRGAASPEISRFLRAALESKEQAGNLRLMYGQDFGWFKKRLIVAQQECKAAPEIKKLGGEVTRDEESPGKPVVLVNLSGTAITDDQLACLGGLSDLRELDLGRTRITDKGLVHLRGLTSLQTLSLVRTPVSGEGLAHLKGLRDIRGLYLVRTQVTDANLIHLKGVTSLRELTLVRTPVTDAGLAHLKGLTDLRLLNLTGTNVTDRGLADLKELTNLDTLSLARTGVTDEGLAALKGSKGLRVLDLLSTRVAGTGLAQLKGLGKLHHLYLSDSKVNDKGLAHVQGLTELRVLWLEDTQVTDAGLVHLEGLKQLRTLSLSGTKVTEAGVKRLKEALPRTAIHPLGQTETGARPDGSARTSPDARRQEEQTRTGFHPGNYGKRRREGRRRAAAICAGDSHRCQRYGGEPCGRAVSHAPESEPHRPGVGMGPAVDFQARLEVIPGAGQLPFLQMPLGLILQEQGELNEAGIALSHRGRHPGIPGTRSPTQPGEPGVRPEGGAAENDGWVFALRYRWRFWSC